MCVLWGKKHNTVLLYTTIGNHTKCEQNDSSEQTLSCMEENKNKKCNLA